MQISTKTRGAFVAAILAYVEEVAGSRPGPPGTAARSGSGGAVRPASLDLEGIAALLEAAARMLGDDAVGLHFAAGFDFDALGLFSYVVLHAPTLGTALRNIERYSDAVTTGVHARLEVGERTASLHVPAWGGPGGLRQLDEAAVLFLLRMLRRLAGPGWAPRGIAFRHPEPPDLTTHRRLLGVPLRFDQPSSRIDFASRDLERRTRDADRLRLPIVERHLEDVVSDHADPDPWRNELELQLASVICDGHPNIRTIARRLGTSVRTLQRRLDERDLCYRDVVAGVRMRIARHYLEGPGLAGTELAEIAFLLGYSELSAFDRAFRRWTGMSPGVYRRRAAGGMARPRPARGVSPRST